MKKIALVTFLALAGSIASGQTQVVNRDVVGVAGFVKVLAERGKLTLGCSDFDDRDSPGGLAISNAIGTQLPVGAQILLWDNVGQTWRPSITRTVFGWGAAGSNRLPRGSAFFIRLPASVPSNSYQVFFMGQVPDGSTPEGTGTTFNIVRGLNLKADPYPVSRKWTSTVMSAALPINSQILIWNATNQSYNSSITKSVFGWGAAGKALTNNPGAGFWIRSTGTVTFSETKPYRWP